MATKLTGRQREFLSQFLELHEESGEPLHYSVVADRLGVSPITAYDMLRVLEERGLLASEYVVRGQGPGRSAIVFLPTRQAEPLMSGPSGEDWSAEEWEAVRRRIEQTLQSLGRVDIDKLLEEILQRIAEAKTPIRYMTGMITAILLHLHQVATDVKDSAFLERLRSLDLSAELAGLTLGLSLVERANRRVTSLLLDQTSRYQELLARLSNQGRKQLAEFAKEVMSIVEA